MAKGGKDLCILGYHAYHGIWKAVVGETLVCMREPQNVHDKYAIAVKKDGTVIGHLPRSVSCWFAVVKERRQYSLHSHGKAKTLC